MGKKCAICESDATVLNNRRKIANNEVVCQKCLRRAKSLTLKQTLRLIKVTSDEIRKSISESVGEKVLNFKADEAIGKVEFDFGDESMLIPGILGNVTIIKFKDIESFDLVEDGETVTKGGIKRAIVGGALFGRTGAVVGALTANKKKEYCNTLQIQIIERDKTKPTIRIPYISRRTQVDSAEYDNSLTMASLVMNKLQTIYNEYQSHSMGSGESETDINSLSLVEKMNQYKELLDSGIITQEEFDRKKKELLDL